MAGMEALPAFLRSGFFFLEPQSSLICSATSDDGDEGGGGEDKARELLDAANKAVASQLKRKLDSAIAKALEPLQTQIAELAESRKTETLPEKGEDGASAEVKKLQSELEAMRKQVATEKEARETERKQREEGEAKAQIRDLLDKAGVDKRRLRGALAVVRDQISRAEDGSLTYRAERKGYTEDLPLADGITEWVGTDEGKSYLAPVDTKGSGTRAPANGGRLPPSPPPKPGTPEAKAQRKAEAARQLVDATRGMLAGGGGVEL